MTTFAYRDGMLAADSGACLRQGLRTGDLRKIFRGPGNSLVAAAGAANDCLAFVRWVNGAEGGEWEAKDKDAGFKGLVIGSDGAVTHYGLYGPGYSLEAPFFAGGTGEELALGAMAMGARADQAVEIACRYDIWSSGPVQIERVGRTLTLVQED